MIEEIIRNIIDLPKTYIGEAPLDVYECQWIRSLSGKSKTFFDKDTYDYPEFNIYVRDTSNAVAKERVDSIYHKLKNYVGANYVILANRLPHFVGRDNKYRAIYAFKIEYQLGGY